MSMETARNTDLITQTSAGSDISHPLKNRWILWAHLPQDQDWSPKSYKKICGFQTLEQVIAVTQSLPEDFVKNCMLFLMKDGIAPVWEHALNRNGGCFSYKVANKSVFKLWQDLTFALVGDCISTNQEFINSVTGITISPKKNFCIMKIWLTNCNHQNPQVVTNEIALSPQGCLFKKHTPEY
jgi:hypothetical protein